MRTAWTGSITPEQTCPQCQEALLPVQRLKRAPLLPGLHISRDRRFIYPLILSALLVWSVVAVVSNLTGKFAWPGVFMLLGLEGVLGWRLIRKIGLQTLVTLVREKVRLWWLTFPYLILFSWLIVLEPGSRKHFSGPWDSGAWGKFGLLLGALLFLLSMTLIMLLPLLFWLNSSGFGQKLRRRSWALARAQPEDWLCPTCWRGPVTAAEQRPVGHPHRSPL